MGANPRGEGEGGNGKILLSIFLVSRISLALSELEKIRSKLVKYSAGLNAKPFSKMYLQSLNNNNVFTCTSSVRFSPLCEHASRAAGHSFQTLRCPHALQLITVSVGQKILTVRFYFGSDIWTKR